MLTYLKYLAISQSAFENPKPQVALKFFISLFFTIIILCTGGVVYAEVLNCAVGDYNKGNWVWVSQHSDTPPPCSGEEPSLTGATWGGYRDPYVLIQGRLLIMEYFATTIPSPNIPNQRSCSAANCAEFIPSAKQYIDDNYKTVNNQFRPRTCFTGVGSTVQGWENSYGEGAFYYGGSDLCFYFPQNSGDRIPEKPVDGNCSPYSKLYIHTAHYVYSRNIALWTCYQTGEQAVQKDNNLGSPCDSTK